MAATARLEPGTPAPDFALPDADGNEVRLSDLRGRKVVLYVYPAASTPGCTTQACDFRDNLGSLQAAGYDGWVGLEYAPSTDTSSSLAWLPVERRATPAGTP